MGTSPHEVAVVVHVVGKGAGLALSVVQTTALEHSSIPLWSAPGRQLH